MRAGNRLNVRTFSQQPVVEFYEGRPIYGLAIAEDPNGVPQRAVLRCICRISQEEDSIH